MKKILCISTAGKDSQDAIRMRRLTSKLDADITYFDFDRSRSRLASSQEVWFLLKTSKWDLVYLEGTGIAAGFILICAALGWQQSFIISSGDPVGGYFRVTKNILTGSVMELYERLLYKTCTGFVGWTPYLTGMAMKMGAKQAMTAEGGVDLEKFYPYPKQQRMAVRERLGLHPEHFVCGMVGSLQWSPSQSYCYGYELVKSLKYVQRHNVSILIVGDGDGRARLEAEVPAELRSRTIFTGRLTGCDVVDAINAMDIGFVTQSGELGRYRLSTKLPEYLACGVPVAMSPIPGFYDYAASSGWLLPNYHPSTTSFHIHCAQWIDHLDWDDISTKAKQTLNVAQKYFDYDEISTKFCHFVDSLSMD